MKRDLRLRQLSDDHHQALVLARRAMRAAASADTEVCLATWNEVIRRFHQELAPHFAIEEESLLPAVERHGGADLAKRTRDDHAELRILVGDDRDGLHGHGGLHARDDVVIKLNRFGALLRDHVRFEERILFAFSQETLDDAALDAVANAREHRGAGAH